MLTFSPDQKDLFDLRFTQNLFEDLKRDIRNIYPDQTNQLTDEELSDQIEMLALYGQSHGFIEIDCVVELCLLYFARNGHIFKDYDCLKLIKSQRMTGRQKLNALKSKCLASNVQDMEHLAHV